jgi:probable rRNA maturation factor
MLIIIENRSKYKLAAKIFYSVIKSIEEEELDKYEEVNLLLTDDDTIKNLNGRYRGKNKKTDVLSFPSQIPGLPFLGDIIIDTSVANEQKGNHSLEEELQFLFLHGVLHLLGYDHISAQQKKIMDAKEKKYRENLIYI